MAELDEILKGKEPEPKTEAEPANEAATETTETQPRNEKGQYASKAEPEANEQPKAEATPPPKEAQEPAQSPTTTEPAKTEQQAQPQDPNKDWTYAAYKDKSEQAKQWRERATQYERELAEYRRKEAEAQQQANAPDMFADPDGYREYLRQEFDQREKKLRFETSMQMAHIQHGELFDQAYAEAGAAVQGGDRALASMLQQSPNPGQALVAWYKREQAAREIGDDPAAYRERVRQEIEAELKAKAEAEQSTQQVQPDKPVMPSNLAGARSTGARTGPPWSGPQPLADILAQRK